jgi:hypothetical protein
MASEYFYIIGFIDSNGSHVTHKGIVIREYEEKMSDLFDRVSATYPSYSSCVSWSCTYKDGRNKDILWYVKERCSRHHYEETRHPSEDYDNVLELGEE